MDEKKVNVGAVQNKDSELRYMKRPKGRREGAPAADVSPSGK